MTKLAYMYAQLDNIVSKHIDTYSLNELSEDFMMEYFSLREEILADLSNLLMPQYNFDTSISLEQKNEIIDLLNIYYQLDETMKSYPIDELSDIQNKVENMCITKYMKLYGYKKNKDSLWTE